MATELLKVILQMSAGQYKREAREAATATGKISQNAKTAGGQTGTLQTKMVGFGSVLRGAAVTGGILAVARGLGDAVDAAERSASALANTQKIIEQTGGAANVSADDIVELSRRLSALTGVQDEVVQEGANVLLTFKGIKNEVGEGNDVFDRTAALMLDISAVMGTDATSGAIQLGKALNDPVANMGALSRAGLTFSDTQKTQIKDLVANNDLLSAQKLILGELESQLGGTAAASADATDKIGNAFGEISEGVGTLLLPLLEDVGIELQSIVGLIDELDKVAAQAGGAAESAAAFLAVVSEETGGAGTLNGINRALEGVVIGLIPGISRMERFRDTLEELAPRLSLPELRAARAGIDQLGESMGLTGSEIELVAEVLDDRLSAAVSEGADEVLRLKYATEDTGDAADAAADDVEDFGDEVEETGKKTKTTAEIVRDLNNAYLEAANPIFAAQGALDRYRSAQENLIQVQKDGKSTAEDIANAELDVAAAAIEAEGALRELGAGDVDKGIGVIADALGKSDEEARALLEALGILDGKNVTSTVTTDFKIRGSNAAIAAARSGSGTAAFRDAFRAGGGPVTGSQPYIVGERGPELFVPSGSGNVISNADITRLIAGISGGSTHNYNIPITSSGNQAADAQLVGAVASVLRRMESI